MLYRHILKRFPDIELPYEYITHKEAHSEFYTAIPYGKKFFAWFTYYNNSNMCFIIEFNTKTSSLNPDTIYPAVASYDSDLCFGTVLYGTCNKYGDVKNFIIENILYYKGKRLENYNFIDKLQIFEKLLEKDISSDLFVKNQHIFSLPVMNTNLNTFKTWMDEVNYQIYGIQMRNLYGETVNVNYINKNKKAVFMIQATIKSDIYELYYKDDKNFKFYDTAFIDSFKTSKFMNNIFRHVRENAVLDKIEESDSEEEFEDISLDKFLIKDKSCNILCEYSLKFKKCIPIKLADDKDIIKKKDLGNIINNTR